MLVTGEAYVSWATHLIGRFYMKLNEDKRKLFIDTQRRRSIEVSEWIEQYSQGNQLGNDVSFFSVRTVTRYETKTQLSRLPSGRQFSSIISQFVNKGFR